MSEGTVYGVQALDMGYEIRSRTNDLRFIRRDGNLILQRSVQVVSKASAWTEWEDIPIVDDLPKPNKE